MAPDRDTDGFEPGTSVVDLSSWRKVGVSGADAIAWLNDLLTADLSDLAPNRARRSLLLSPNGAIRADVTVAVPGGSVVLFQDPSQPEPIDQLLERYVLSSDVHLDDRSDELCLFAFPGRETPPEAPGSEFTTPSCIGDGIDLTAPAEDHARLADSLSKAFTMVDDAALDAWRVTTGAPRFGIDALPADLPQEAGLAAVVSFDKGCYLGQEAVAKVQNLGHPRRLVVHLSADREVSAGDALVLEAGDDDAEVGRVTSAVRSDGGSVALGRVRWDAREGPYRTGAGVRLLRLDAD